jgi:hypothetical protein
MAKLFVNDLKNRKPLVKTGERGPLPFQMMMLKLAETLKDHWRNRA